MHALYPKNIWGVFSEVIMSESQEEQVLYLSRWVSKAHFKAFVYKKDAKHLAKTYQEFSDLISSGVWQAQPQIKELADTNEKVVGITKRVRKCPNPRKA